MFSDNMINYEKMYLGTGDLGWIKKHAEALPGPMPTSQNIIKMPSIKDFSKALISSSSLPFQGELVQEELSKITAYALAGYYDTNLNEEDDAFTGINFSTNLSQALVPELIDLEPDVISDILAEIKSAASSYSNPFVRVSVEKLDKDACLRLIHFTLLKAYIHLYSWFVFSNRAVTVLSELEEGMPLTAANISLGLQKIGAEDEKIKVRLSDLIDACKTFRFKMAKEATNRPGYRIGMLEFMMADAQVESLERTYEALRKYVAAAPENPYKTWQGQPLGDGNVFVEIDPKRDGVLSIDKLWPKSFLKKRLYKSGAPARDNMEVPYAKWDGTEGTLTYAFSNIESIRKEYVDAKFEDVASYKAEVENKVKEDSILKLALDKKILSGTSSFTKEVLFSISKIALDPDVAAISQVEESKLIGILKTILNVLIDQATELLSSETEFSIDLVVRLAMNSLKSEEVYKYLQFASEAEIESSLAYLADNLLDLSVAQKASAIMGSASRRVEAIGPVNHGVYEASFVASIKNPEKGKAVMAEIRKMVDANVKEVDDLLGFVPSALNRRDSSKYKDIINNTEQECLRLYSYFVNPNTKIARFNQSAATNLIQKKIVMPPPGIERITPSELTGKFNELLLDLANYDVITPEDIADNIVRYLRYAKLMPVGADDAAKQLLVRYAPKAKGKQTVFKSFIKEYLNDVYPDALDSDTKEDQRFTGRYVSKPAVSQIFGNHIVEHLNAPQNYERRVKVKEEAREIQEKFGREGVKTTIGTSIAEEFLKIKELDAQNKLFDERFKQYEDERLQHYLKEFEGYDDAKLAASLNEELYAGLDKDFYYGNYQTMAFEYARVDACRDLIQRLREKATPEDPVKGVREYLEPRLGSQLKGSNFSHDTAMAFFAFIGEKITNHLHPRMIARTFEGFPAGNQARGLTFGLDGAKLPDEIKLRVQNTLAQNIGGLDPQSATQEDQRNYDVYDDATRVAVAAEFGSEEQGGQGGGQNKLTSKEVGMAEVKGYIRYLQSPESMFKTVKTRKVRYESVDEFKVKPIYALDTLSIGGMIQQYFWSKSPYFDESVKDDKWFRNTMAASAAGSFGAQVVRTTSNMVYDMISKPDSKIQSIDELMEKVGAFADPIWAFKSYLKALEARPVALKQKEVQKRDSGATIDDADSAYDHFMRACSKLGSRDENSIILELKKYFNERANRIKSEFPQSDPDKIEKFLVYPFKQGEGGSRESNITNKPFARLTVEQMKKLLTVVGISDTALYQVFGRASDVLQWTKVLGIASSDEYRQAEGFEEKLAKYHELSAELEQLSRFRLDGESKAYIGLLNQIDVSELSNEQVIKVYYVFNQMIKEVYSRRHNKKYSPMAFVELNSDFEIWFREMSSILELVSSDTETNQIVMAHLNQMRTTGKDLVTKLDEVEKAADEIEAIIGDGEEEETETELAEEDEELLEEQVGRLDQEDTSVVGPLDRLSNAIETMVGRLVEAHQGKPKFELAMNNASAYVAYLRSIKREEIAGWKGLPNIETLIKAMSGYSYEMFVTSFTGEFFRDKTSTYVQRQIGVQRSFEISEEFEEVVEETEEAAEEWKMSPIGQALENVAKQVDGRLSAISYDMNDLSSEDEMDFDFESAPSAEGANALVKNARSFVAYVRDLTATDITRDNKAAVVDYLQGIAQKISFLDLEGMSKIFGSEDFDDNRPYFDNFFQDFKLNVGVSKPITIAKRRPNLTKESYYSF